MGLQHITDFTNLSNRRVNNADHSTLDPINIAPTDPSGAYFTKWENNSKLYTMYASEAATRSRASYQETLGSLLLIIKPIHIGIKATRNLSVFSSKSGGMSCKKYLQCSTKLKREAVYISKKVINCSLVD